MIQHIDSMTSLDPLYRDMDPERRAQIDKLCADFMKTLRETLDVPRDMTMVASCPRDTTTMIRSTTSAGIEPRKVEVLKKRLEDEFPNFDIKTLYYDKEGDRQFLASADKSDDKDAADAVRYALACLRAMQGADKAEELETPENGNGRVYGAGLLDKYTEMAQIIGAPADPRGKTDLAGVLDEVYPSEPHELYTRMQAFVEQNPSTSATAMIGQMDLAGLTISYAEVQNLAEEAVRGGRMAPLVKDLRAQGCSVEEFQEAGIYVIDNPHDEEPLVEGLKAEVEVNAGFVYAPLMPVFKPAPNTRAQQEASDLTRICAITGRKLEQDESHEYGNPDAGIMFGDKDLND